MTKFGGTIIGVPLKRVLQNSKISTTQIRHIKFSRYVNIVERLNMTKFRGTAIESPLKQAL